jgi:hypothetical protein
MPSHFSTKLSLRHSFLLAWYRAAAAARKPSFDAFCDAFFVCFTGGMVKQISRCETQKEESVSNG